MKIKIRQPNINDMQIFIDAMQRSHEIHQNWVKPPKTNEEFNLYLDKFADDNNYSFIVYDDYNPDKILGVINITQIVRGLFQNGFLSYYTTIYGANKGIMSKGLRLVIDYAFNQLKLHRLEANIQPDNLKSIKFILNNGFEYEGYSKQYLYINGSWKDHARYALLNNSLDVTNMP